MILLAAVLTAVLLPIAALHAYWGLGGVWPASDVAALARAVVGDGRTRMPPPWSCFAVAVVLAGVAAWPWVILAGARHDGVVVVSIVIAGVFFLRGLAGYSPRWRSRFPVEPFAARDRQIYSPLCMVIATGFMALLAEEM